MSSVDQILRAGWGLLKLINEILDLAVVESARRSLSSQPTSEKSNFRSILYVEDNLANLQLVEALIERRLDLSLLTAAEALTGIAMARTLQPDAILMDINLPGMTGLQALKILKEDPLTARIPVLALTANAIPVDIEEGLSAGFFRYITKPIDFRSFMDSVDAALEHSERTHP